MSVLSSEAVVLRTWPVQEADLIVSFFTRDYGKMRGVAKSALKSRRRFGGALEPMTVAQAWFAEKPRQELVRLDQLEIIRSPLAQPIDPTRLAVLSFYAELLDEALPEHDPQETVFRLLLSVLDQTTCALPAAARAKPGPSPQAAGPWMPLTYFSLWMTRLMGLLPDLAHCIVCGEPLQARRNLVQQLHRRPALRPSTAPPHPAPWPPIPGNWPSACSANPWPRSPPNPGPAAAPRTYAASPSRPWSATSKRGSAPPKPSPASAVEQTCHRRANSLIWTAKINL